MTSMQPKRKKCTDIIVGKATVVYARSLGNLPAGWVLPGGQRTDNFAEAHGVAVQMDELMRGSK